MTNIDWTDAAKRLVKVELAREGVTLAQLAERLRVLGAEETEASVKSKLHRGTFSAVFLLQCITALGQDSVNIAAVLRSRS